MEEKKEKLIRQFTGTVVSSIMDKTIVVSVEKVLTHKIYKKQYKKTAKFKVHDEKNEAKVGDVVSFIESRPISKEKKWRLVKIVK